MRKPLLALLGEKEKGVVTKAFMRLLKKLLLTSALVLVAFTASMQVARAQDSTSFQRFLRRVGVALLPLDTTWELGSATQRWAKGWFSDLDTSLLTIGGAVTGDLHINDDNYFTAGNTFAAPDAALGWNTAQTVDALFLGLPAAQNVFVIAERADAAFDFAHGAQADPTVFIHSATQSTTQWVGITHNQTNALITTGAGDLFIQPVGNDVSIRDTTNARGINLRTTAAGTQSIAATAGILSLSSGAAANLELNAGSGMVTDSFGDAGTSAIWQTLHVDNTNAASHSLFRATSGGASGGDAALVLQITGAGIWSITNDNDAGDVLVFANAAIPGASNELILSSTELTPGVNAGSALGTGLISWNGLFLVSGTTINWGNGNVVLTNTASDMTWTGAQTFVYTEEAATSGTPTFLTYTGAAHTGITAATEDIGVNFNLSATKTWAAGAGPLAAQREFVIQAPTYVGNAGGALTMTFATTLNVGGPPIAGANMTISNPIIARFGADTASGVSSTVSISHAQNTANSNSRLWQIVAGASGGDAYIQQTVAAVSDWTFGLDNSDSDAWVLANSTALGTTNALRVTSQQINLGSAGNFTINSADTSESSIVLQNQTVTRVTAGGSVSITPTGNSDVSFSALALNPTQSLATSAGRVTAALSAFVTTSGAIAVQDVFGIHLTTNDISATGSAVRTGGILIENMEDAQATNPRAIAINAQTGDNNNKAIWLGGTGSNNAIQFGNSPMMYSSGAEVLRFDDSSATRGISMTLTAAGAQTIGATAGNFQINGAATTSTVFNSGSIDTDFLVNGDTVANIIFVDASNDTIRFGSVTTGVNQLFTINFPTKVIANTAQGRVVDIIPALTEGTAGAHPLLSGLYVGTLTLTDGLATTDVATTVYIEGAPTLGTLNYSLFVDAGISRFDGDIVAAGDITSSDTGSLGWSVVNAANQACNTTCTNACVVGIDTAAVGNFLACTDVTADSCLCAGAN